MYSNLGLSFRETLPLTSEWDSLLWMEPGRRPIGGHHGQIRQPPGVGRQQQQIPVVGHRSVGTTYILCGWVQCQGCGSGSGPFWLEPDPENFLQIRILSVLCQCKVVWTRTKYFKNRGFTHFQVNFSKFSDKNNHHSNIRRNMFDVKNSVWLDTIRVPVASGWFGSCFKNSDFLDPDPAENGPDPQPW